jgi:hypothetical protein
LNVPIQKCKFVQHGPFLNKYVDYSASVSGKPISFKMDQFQINLLAIQLMFEITYNFPPHMFTENLV